MTKIFTIFLEILLISNEDVKKANKDYLLFDIFCQQMNENEFITQNTFDDLARRRRHSFMNPVQTIY